MLYLVIAFSSLLFTIFFTPYLINYLKRSNIVDHPDEERKIHTSPIPRMGGLVIYSVVVILLLSFFHNHDQIKFFVYASFILLFIGILDDVLGVSWSIKMLAQAASAVLLIVFLYPRFNSILIFGFELPIIPGIILLSFFIIGTINAFNLMDGLDGLASSISLNAIAVSFLISLSPPNSFVLILCAALAGSLIGFLKFNAFPARIFLGDTGSLTLGLFTVTVVLFASLSPSGQSLSLSFPIIVLAIPIVDTLKVMMSRVLNKKHPFLADKSHIHHILYSKSIKHKTIVFIISVYSLLFALTGVYYSFYSRPAGFIIFMILLIPLLFAKQLLDKLIKKQNVILYGKSVKRMPEVFINYYKKIILPFVSVMLLVSLFMLMPFDSIINQDFILISLLIIVLLVIYTFINYRMNHIVTDIIVLFNIIIFFAIVSKNPLLYKDLFFIPVFGDVNIHLLIISVLLVVVGFFLYFRDRIRGKDEAFLTGIDLIILAFITLAFISANMLPFKDTMLLSDTMFRSFLVYLFYKIIIRIKPKFHLTLYASSFIFTLIAQSILLFL